MVSRRFLLIAPLATLGLAACAGGPRRSSAPPQYSRGFVDVPFATWRDDEPDYRLYPGDQIDTNLFSAPELNRSVTVQPDGRIVLPLLQPIMAADLSAPQLAGRLSQAYASQLIDPRTEVSVKLATPIKVFVGGEVAKAGVYDMPGDIDVLQSIIIAGGFLISAEPHAVVLIRRGADGRPMMRKVDLGRAVRGSPQVVPIALRRFDIVYAPRSAISNIGLFVQQYLRDVVPVQFSYATGANGFLSTR